MMRQNRGMFSFVDDEFMSSKNTESMHGFYRNAPRTMTPISPTDVGATRQLPPNAVM